ncbi:MAG: dienelactone hydrolase family protein [Pyrinomonadaceae bacterium]
MASMMASEMITFKSNGTETSGYLALPATGKGSGIIVIQEWWGLVPHIKDVADRFAGEGFVALAPDLYHGKSATSPDEAGKLMMALNIEQAGKDISGAIEYLKNHNAVNSAVTSGSIGTIGFCMGGALSLYAATINSGVGACIVFYGIHPAVSYKFENLQAPVLGIFGSNDKSVPPATVHELESKLKRAGKSVEVHIYENSDHAFFNDTRPTVYNAEAARDAWKRSLDFFRANLK